MYGIKDGYRENPGPVYFTDDVEAERGELFQPDVYTMAELLVQLCGMDTIVDVGCGQATKLALIRERHAEWRYIGVDYGGNLDVCRARYPWGEWVEHDLEHHIALSGLRDVGACVTVCSDVIEHLVDPDPLVRSLWTFAHGHGPVVLSTPERDVQHGYDHMGPSPNVCHVREWNAQELNAWLVASGHTVAWHGLTRGTDRGWAMATQLLVLTKGARP